MTKQQQTQQDHRTARITIAGVMPVLALSAGLIPFLFARDSLPDRLASHFDSSGVPDGSMTVAWFVTTTGGLLAVGVAILVAIGLGRRPLQSGLPAILAFLGGFLAGLGAGMLAGGVLSQEGNVSWEDASSPWPTILASLVLATTLGAWAARVATRLPTSDARSSVAGSAPVMSLEPGEHAVWRTVLHNSWLTAGGIAVIVAGVVIAVATMWWIALPAGLSGLAMLSFGRLEVRADRSGLHVAYGPLRWPSTTVAIDRIDKATVIDVRPMKWGGWGYRGSLKLMNQAAVVHRAGPGVRLDLDDGKVFVVTVDDPETPAGLVNAEVSRLAV